MDPVRAAIGNFENRVGCQLALHGQAPELRLRNVDVGIVVAQLAGVRGLAGPGRPNGPRLLLVTKMPHS